MSTKSVVLYVGALVFSSAFALDNGGRAPRTSERASAASDAIRLAGEVKTPSGVNESMPEMTGNQDHPTMGKKSGQTAKPTRGPSSVSESMPEMTGGIDHPTMNKKGNKPVTQSKKGGKAAPEPSSVSESMPEMTGGQKHPTMGK